MFEMPEAAQSLAAALPSDLRPYLLPAILVLVAIVAGLALWWRARQRVLPPGDAVGKPKLGPTEEAPHVPVVAPDRPQRPAGDRALQEGLKKTRGGFITRIAGLLSRKKIDAELLEQLEETLLTADIGVKTSARIFERVREQLSRAELADTDAVFRVIRDESRRLLEVGAPPVDFSAHKPYVVLVIGVNGVGKTTTIGKLAAQQVNAGKKVVLGAGDTFRAAAVEQLEEWGRRAGAEVVKGKDKADPSAVIFDAVKHAQSIGADVVFADTAGRLHNKAELMDELQKVRRVLKKAEPTAPHQTWLVLDSTNGQNAIAQAATFKEVMEITGIILTKLDGTAKGGVILGICNELQVPVRYIGIGEKVNDLRPFDPAEFVEALYAPANDE